MSKSNKKKIDKTTMFILVPRELKNHFKAYCAKRQKSMNETLVDFIEQTVSKTEKI